MISEVLKMKPSDAMKYLIAISACLFILGCDSKKPVKITDNSDDTTKPPVAVKPKAEPAQKKPPEPPKYQPSKLLPEEPLGDFNFGWSGKTLTKKETLPKCKKGWVVKDIEKKGGPFGHLERVSWLCPKLKIFGNTALVHLMTFNKQISYIEAKEFKRNNKAFKKLPLMLCTKQKVIVSNKKEIQESFESESYIGNCKGSHIMVGHIQDQVTVLMIDKTQQLLDLLLPIMREDMKTPDYGKVFKLGDFEYKVISAELTKQIGKNRFIKQKATKGGTFVTIKYSIKNADNKTRTVLTGDLVLKDAKGRQFRASSKATRALVMTNKAELLVQELQPGLPVEQYIAFEVPLDSVEKRSKLKLIIPEKGMLGTKQVEFDMWFNQ
jgi:hypothetical protein